MTLCRAGLWCRQQSVAIVHCETCALRTVGTEATSGKVPRLPYRILVPGPYGGELGAFRAVDLHLTWKHFTETGNSLLMQSAAACAHFISCCVQFVRAQVLIYRHRQQVSPCPYRRAPLLGAVHPVPSALIKMHLHS